MTRKVAGRPVPSNRQTFALLKGARRVWAVASIHGEAERLAALHGMLRERIEAGDRIVYLGNLIGRGHLVRDTLNELLAFRREFLARAGSFACDIVYLRGSQEEMWQKLLQLQFATDPQGVFKWMLDNGVEPDLLAYGLDPEEGLREARAGPVRLSRWTNHVRGIIRSHPGHYELLGLLKRAAHTDDGGLLLVNAGIDPARPLETQKDSFWWVSGQFSRITEPYGGYRRVVRGFGPDHPGLVLTDHTATVDAGCGFGGSLIAACFSPDGALTDSIEV
jgi:serine/threonine protein phosphatase 1